MSVQRICWIVLALPSVAMAVPPETPVIVAPAQTRGFTDEDWERYRDQQREIIARKKGELTRENERLDEILDFDNRANDAANDLIEVAKSGVDVIQERLSGEEEKAYADAVQTAKDLTAAENGMNNIGSDQLDQPDVVNRITKLEEAIKQAEENIEASRRLQNAIQQRATGTAQKINSKKQLEFVLVDQSSALAKEVAKRRDAERQKANSGKSKPVDDAKLGPQDKPKPGEGNPVPDKPPVTDKPDKPEKPDKPDKPDKPEGPTAIPGPA